MLRRKPTAVTITAEDIAAFEEARLRRLQENKENKENKQTEQGKASANTQYDPSDELKPLPGDKARIVRSREERIGIGRRG
ncbi:Anaphase-promoting complex subunit CDC26 [Penicillium herquei]|nr:Anaphase-promoting complex subunit CDC26 [Penicillium herquei]